MGKRATAGTCLASLVKMARALCNQAERECARTGPRRKPEIPDWVLAVLLMTVVLKRRKNTDDFASQSNRMAQSFPQNHRCHPANIGLLPGTYRPE